MQRIRAMEISGKGGGNWRLVPWVLSQPCIIAKKGWSDVVSAANAELTSAPPGMLPVVLCHCLIQLFCWPDSLNTQSSYTAELEAETGLECWPSRAFLNIRLARSKDRGRRVICIMPVVRKNHLVIDVKKLLTPEELKENLAAL